MRNEVEKTTEEITQSEKPFWKKWWFWTLVVFIIIIIASSGGEKKEITPQAIPPIQEEITQPPQEEIQKQQEVQQPKTEIQRIVYLSEGAELVPIIIDISPKDLSDKMKRALISGDIDGFIEISNKYNLDVPENTKALLLGEEIMLEPDLDLGRKNPEFFVKIKILEGQYKDKIGWANRSQIKIQ